jgi:squalene-hopene/tetraprenyl-beta-curcumene cyclase
MRNTALSEPTLSGTRSPRALDAAIDRASAALLALQREDGHWVFELEADATIPAEYMLLQHYLGEIDDEEQTALAEYLRATQAAHGGWPLFHGGDFDLSATVKAYFALKAAGDDPDLPHMLRAREAVLARGGAGGVNVFTRIQLALFGEMDWRHVPVMPVEIMHLPLWFPFHLNKVSYWSRTVIVPLLVLMSRKPRARNPQGVTVPELFMPGAPVPSAGLTGSVWADAFARFDRRLRWMEPRFPRGWRERGIAKAVAFVKERLNGDDGLGGIYPAIANSVMMFDCLGYPKDHPDFVTAKSALKKLLVRTPGRSYCQPCLSPIWDTGLACHALMEVGSDAATRATRQGLDWIAERQILDLKGDWAVWRPRVRPGGWAFQYQNAHYPDVDDAAVVALALHRFDPERYQYAIERAAEWIDGMQSRNGGWGAFDADNTCSYLNYIPFADHGALLDPPTVDVSARCVSFLAQLGGKQIGRALDYLLREQEPDGSWFGRWGTNYIYGTWSALCALNAAGFDAQSQPVRRAAEWLLARQRGDGGWGEDGRSYWSAEPRGEAKESTPSQTAWALLGLMAAGEIDHPAVARGIQYLTDMQNVRGLWEENAYTAVGFPRVFYLRYHGYRAFFPLWALARYRNLRRSNAHRTSFGL